MTKKKADDTVLSIRGKKIRYEHRVVNIKELRFYGKNPRIASILAEHAGAITEEVIDKKLWDKNATHALYNTIEKDGGLIHPVIVFGNEVLEGNTRLCCYRHLHNATKNRQWSHIKCHVILDVLSQQEIYRLLCTEHIEGKIEWDAYEKAHLYYAMKNNDKMTLQQISDVSAESAPTIGYKIKAYELMVDHAIVDKNKYSHFEQLVTNGPIKEIMKKSDRHIVTKVVSLIKGGKVSTAQDIRKIADIHKHKPARKRLFQDNESVTQVYHDLKAKAPMTDSPFMKDVESLAKRIASIKREERDGLRRNKRDLLKIEKFARELIKLCGELGIQINIPRKMRKR